MLPVTDISRFCMHDGPGVRTTVFFRGCSLHCFWCHNPETSHSVAGPIFYESKCIGCHACKAVCPAGCQLFEPERRFDRAMCLDCGLCAEACPADALHPVSVLMSPEEILKKVELDRAFYGAEGGVTLSGGEPLLHKEAVTLLRLCQEAGLHTAIETAGFVPTGLLKEALPYTDLFLFDIKDTDSERFERNCGGKLQTVLQHLRMIDDAGCENILRCVLLHGVNAEAEHFKQLAGLFRSLSHCRRIEILPYHAVYGAKQRSVGLPDTSSANYIPTGEDLTLAENIFRSKGVPFLIRGRLSA